MLDGLVWKTVAIGCEERGERRLEDGTHLSHSSSAHRCLGSLSTCTRSHLRSPSVISSS